MASASSRRASSSSFCAATPCSTSVDESSHRRLRVFHARLRLLELGASCSKVGVNRWNLEAHQQIAGLDGVPFGLWQLDDACGVRRRNGPIGSRRGRHGAGGADDALDRLWGHLRHADGGGGGRLDLFDRMTAAAGYQRSGGKRCGSKAEPHLSAVPMARSRSASAT